ncbi:ABC transporter ATP-binding protein [Clostridium swellfunianum]|uniref:ABC transporter ATP-binding protein n=1 Tax=Clostridium swellfunianum TaxID=1367462 RepID=UPI00202DE0D1|nr:ABC transporter ATP-binding protein [Clostridium swellfunianum]MCM0648292.1 ABC transporter ATP-binding protein [Clostridium swellfunianum]
MIEIENLVRRYGQHVVLSGLNLTIHKGEILGLLGPNGAGKSTTMNIITGYIGASEGTVQVDGIDILKEPKKAKKKMGYLPEIPPLYMDMTVDEYLKFVCKIKNIESKKIKEVLDGVCDTVKVTDYRNRLIRNLSKGYKQRVGLAQAIIGNPEVLILDEPTVGLDPKEIIEIRNLIKEIGKNHTVILSSHILSEVSAVCDRVVIINKGEIVASGTPEELAKKVSYSSKILLRVKGDGKEIAKKLKDIKSVQRVELQGTIEADTLDLLVEAKQDMDIREQIFWKLSKAEVPVLMMKPVDLSLEEVFLQVTTQ